MSQPATPSPRSGGVLVRDRPHTPAGTMSIALFGGALTGAAAWWLHGILPSPWSTLANTSALWGVVAFAASRAQRARGAMAVVAGALALLGMVIAFALLAGASTGEWLAFIVVGVAAGAAFGHAASLAQSEGGRQRLTAAAIVGGVIAGEGLYGVAVVDAAAPQWWVELALGVTAALVLARSTRHRLAAVGLVALVAVTLLSAYSAYDAALVS